MSRVAAAAGIAVTAWNVEGNAVGTGDAARIEGGWVIHTNPEAVRYEIEVTDW